MAPHASNGGAVNDVVAVKGQQKVSSSANVCGWMTKRSRWLKQWRPRYVVLDKNRLTFAIGDRDEPHGFVELGEEYSLETVVSANRESSLAGRPTTSNDDSSSSQPHTRTFKISSPLCTVPSVYLTVKTDEQMGMWMAAIENACRLNGGKNNGVANGGVGGRSGGEGGSEPDCVGVEKVASLQEELAKKKQLMKKKEEDSSKKTPRGKSSEKNDEPVWMRYVHDDSGRSYYHNIETGETSWEQPPFDSVCWFPPKARSAGMFADEDRQRK